MARTGHCDSHALQKIQFISFTGSDFLLEVACPGEVIQPKTFTGQTEIQMPSPSQESWSTATLVPWIPSFPGGLTSPLTLCALCSPTTGFFMKSGSILIFLPPFIQEMIFIRDKKINDFSTNQAHRLFTANDSSGAIGNTLHLASADFTEISVTLFCFLRFLCLYDLLRFRFLSFWFGFHWHNIPLSLHKEEAVVPVESSPMSTTSP